MEDAPVPSFMLPAPEPATELGRYRVLSANSGLRVSPLILGGMSIGQAWSGLMGSMTKDDSFKLLDAFCEAGGNFIDTSCNYQDGDSEKWIGDWMAARGNRDQMVLATKYTSNYSSSTLEKGKAPNCAGNHRKSMHMSIEASLERLQTSYIDILYLHWWDHTTSIKEVMDSLHVFVQRGKVLYLGISDTPAWIVSAANQYAIDHGRTPFCIYQGKWNLMERDMERDIVPMCRQFGMAIAPWAALGSGRFQSRRALAERSARSEPLRAYCAQTPDEVRISEALDEVATELGVSVAVVALAWIRAKAPNVFPIVGGRRIEHLHDNITAMSIRLSDEQMKRLEAVKPFEPGFPNNFLGGDPNITGHNHRLARVAPMAFPNAYAGKS